MVNIDSEVLASLKRYEIIERLGVGGMATVYRATDKNLGRDVAIKLLHEHLVYEESFKERFEQEARLIAALNHANIIQVFDFDTLETSTDTVYYMVMPYLSGKTLDAILNECRIEGATLPHDRIHQITSDIASALDYAHENGMVHRDVKPANIIFDDHSRAILTDFGIARLAQHSSITQEGMIVGTPNYMSPEQALGEVIDGRSDIYALGIILYEMLTGRPPFDADGTVSILLKHATVEPPAVSSFMPSKNEALDIVLYNVLEKNPSNRYQTGAALLQDLSAVIASESDSQRLKPTPLLREVMQNASVSSTKVLDSDTLPKTDNIPISTRMTRVLNTAIIRPAKQNPMAFIAIAIAIMALLAVVRITQIQPQTAATPIPTQAIAPVDSMTNDAYDFESDFSRSDGTLELWQQNETGQERRIIDDGEYILSNTTPGIAMTALYDPSYMFDNASITLEGNLSSTSEDPDSAYGIVFRYQDADNYNVFAVDGMGRYSIWVREEGRWRELRAASENWTASDAINPLGERNILTINIVNNVLTAYVNDVAVVELEESTFTSGGVGIYMATASGGSAAAAIDRYVVETAISTEVSSQTDSMTEDEPESMTFDTEPEATEQP
ncbi:MAG: serine/threonine-protein kinase [Anaerolineae bacterium]|nr:serine/threonine-protein kinase [Anaerolineae bacterium]